jgi:hypothetical protein
MIETNFKDGNFLFPDAQLINSIPCTFKIWNDLIFLKKNYTIGFIKTEIINEKHRAIVIATNGQELIGFTIQNIPNEPKQFLYCPFRDENLTNFVQSITRNCQSLDIKWKQKTIYNVCKEVKNKAITIIEKENLENIISKTLPSTSKLKL